MKNKRIIICILALIILITALFIIANWLPVGNENGYFPKEACADIDLTNGSILPQMELYDEDYANTFLCKVEYKGKVNHDAFEEQIDSYSIVEWHPVGACRLRENGKRKKIHFCWKK